jgi:pyruvate/2-oxoacid:ferredoxin oxidoreductase beta subunit/Pyruvate/2-oxoacid:ferredoxin oxidoreductase gamma subunit
MTSLLNTSRPPAFCPGCAHDTVLRGLDRAFQHMGLAGHQIAIVSDIGCSGLFDTFFNTHALHGLHGRALTYAAGIKLARPELQVVVTMGDGGLGIGGAHLLAACRRNLDLTLLVLNNFNFGMTGGQASATTPADARVGSGFLNRLECPLDVGRVLAAAGAAFVTRASAYQKDLPLLLEEALRFKGFSAVELWGVCPGRYLRGNKLTPKLIRDSLAQYPPLRGPVAENQRPEYGAHYRALAADLPAAPAPVEIPVRFAPPRAGRHEVLLLGAAGQRIRTAGTVLCLAGMTAGLNVTQKDDHGITVMSGPSVSEVILSPQEIDFTGIDAPSLVVALAAEGVARRQAVFGRLDSNALLVAAADLEIPATRARVLPLDFTALGIANADRALAALAVLAGRNQVLSRDMLAAALALRFDPQAAAALRERIAAVWG